MGTKHKHAEVIKAWADGEVIQVRSPHSKSAWVDSNQPAFAETLEYRVKPKNIVVKRLVMYDPIYDCVEAYNNPTKWDVSYTFTPEGKLVSVEMIK